MNDTILVDEKIKLLESWVETLNADLEQFKHEVLKRNTEKQDIERFYKKKLDKYISRVVAAQKRVDGKQKQINEINGQIIELKKKHESDSGKI